MISSTLVVVIVEALVAMLLMWAAMSGFLKDPAFIRRAFPGTTAARLVQVLAAVPLAAALLSAILFGLVLGAAPDTAARIGHFVLLAGWWLIATLSGFALLTALRAGVKVPISAVIGLVLSLATLAYFSDLPRYLVVFSVNGYDRAVIVGISLGAMGYTILSRLNRLLL